MAGMYTGCKTLFNTTVHAVVKSSGLHRSQPSRAGLFATMDAYIAPGLTCAVLKSWTGLYSAHHNHIGAAHILHHKTDEKFCGSSLVILISIQGMDYDCV